ncbi:MAG: sodium:proton antiporter [Naasia sp.]|nr:sodium:proton antiporter [Naasia sp.]
MIVDILHAAVAVLMALSIGLVLVRILRGPSIIDRMIASDVVVTILLLAIIADMVINDTRRGIPVLLALSGTAVLGSIAVARYVSRQDRRDGTGQDGGGTR